MLNHEKIKHFIEYSLGIIALIWIFLFLQLSMSSELSDSDIWLHLKTGEYITQHKTVPQVDIYSASIYGKTWINHSPFTQVIFYWLFNSGGPDALIIFSTALILLAFLLLFLCIYKNKTKLWLSVTMLALAIIASRIRFNIRPENFSVLFFCAYLWILTRYKNKKLIFLLPVAQLIWVNCHGFFILGPALIAIFIISEKLKMQKKLPWEWSDCEPMDKDSYRNLITVFLLSTLACLINPNGLKGALYPLTIISNTLIHPSAASNYILELLPPWMLRSEQVSIYYVLLGVSFASFLFNFRKINLSFLLSWIALLGISFNVNRNIIFFNCIACLASVDNFSRVDYKKIFRKILSEKSIFLLKCIILTTIISCFAIDSLRILNEAYYIIDKNQIKSRLFGVTKNYPSKAADFIFKNKLPDNLFNIFNHGAYLIYRLYPNNHVFIDGRTELYSNKFFKDYLRIINADTSTIDGLLAEYNIQTILLSGNFPNLKKLTEYLIQNKKWVLVYLNDDGLIFVRQIIQNQDLAERLRVDLNKWEIAKPDLKKIGLRNINPDLYVKLAQMLYALGAYQKAELQAKEVLNILPSTADAYVVLGEIYLHQDNLDQAYQYLRLASIYAPNNLSTLSALSNYYLQIGDAKNTEEIYKRIIKLSPQYAQGYYLLGIYYKKTKNLNNAIKYLRKATELAPYSTEYLNKCKEVATKIKK